MFLAVSGLSSVSAEKAGHLFPHTKLFGIEFSSQLLAQKERRTALVIGNGAYDSEGKLKNPPNDATDIANALQGLGFEVTLKKDLDQQQMAEVIEQFNHQLRQGGVGLFYYAGHGVQVGGENYLIPIGAKISREQDIRYRTIPLGQILGTMEDAGNPLNIVILDACRDNPSIRRFRRSSSLRGLAPLQFQPEGMLIAFATSPGEVSEDGEGRNSPYTASLLQYIQEPGLPMQLMFNKVRQTVRAITQGRQTPSESISLVGDFAFKPVASVPPISSPRPTSSTPSPIPKPSVSILPSISSFPSPSTLPVPSISKPILISKHTGLNYAPLRNLLAAGKWKEADQETTKMILVGDVQLIYPHPNPSP